MKERPAPALQAQLPRPGRLAHALPWAVLGLSVAASLALGWMAHRTAVERARDQLAARAGDVVERIQGRLLDDEMVLRGALGLFAAQEHVDRGMWRRYVAALRLEQRHPGIQGVGFAAWIPAEQLQAHLRAVRAEGFPEYVVRPAGARPFYTSIVWLEPFDWRNQRAFGYDMFAEPTRRAAMQSACDSGATALSGRVTLVQETEHETQSGVLLYLPVYAAGQAVDGVEARRAALRGFVYSPIRLGNLVRQSLGELPGDLDFTVADLATEAPLFASPGARGAGPPAAGLTAEQQVALFGRAWRFSFVARPALLAAAGPDHGARVLAVGLLLSALLSAIAFVLQRTRQRALAIAGHMVERLEVSEERHRLLFEQSPDGQLLVDPDTGAFLEFNAAAARQLGYAREDLARLRVFDVDAGPEERSRERIAAILRSGRADFDTVHRTRTGELRDVHVTAQIVELAGRRVFQSTWRDITDRRRAERAVIEAHERLRRIGDSLPTGYIYQVVYPAEGPPHFTYLSAGVERVHGVPAAAALADAGVLLRLIEAEDQPLLAAARQRAARELAPIQLEVRYRGPGGEPRWIRLGSAPVRQPDGGLRLDGVALDVTEHKRAESAQLLAGKLESTGLLAGGIAHDFNNLLTIVLLGVELAHADAHLPEEVRESLAEALQAIASARSLTQQFLVFSRGAEPERRLTDLEQLAREVAGLALAGLPGVTCALGAEAGLWAAEVDRGQLAQALRNLVVNAAEAMPGGGTVRIGLANVALGDGNEAGLPAGDHVRLAVADAGEGIAPQVLPHVFDPYFSTKKRGSQKGMGLGLTVAHAVVRKHGGAITVRSAPGRGSTFTVLLPARPAGAATP